MTKLHDFTMEEMMIFTVSVMGGLGALLSVVFKSKCKKISCCCGAFSCDRDVRAVIEEERLEAGKSPRRSERLKLKSESSEDKNIQLDINEPEPEPASI